MKLYSILFSSLFIACAASSILLISYLLNWAQQAIESTALHLSYQSSWLAW